MKTTILEFGEIKKWSVRYNEPQSTLVENAIARSVYIQKTALTEPYPRRVRLTLEELP